MTDILVAGFITIDFIAHVSGIGSTSVPQHASEFDIACGGRAANQAMALTAIESDVSLLARLGSDEHASLLSEELLEIGVGIELVRQSPSQTGLRMICELEGGERQVTVFRGANDFLSVDDLNRSADAFRLAGAVGITTEPAGSVTLRALELAAQHQVPTVLTHAASARPISDRLLASASIVVTSDATCAGLIDPSVAQEHPEAALRALVQRGPRAVILLSAERALLATSDEMREVVSPSRLDSEDAVDAFVAGLLQGLAQSDKLEDSILRGVRTGCLLVD